MSDREGFASAAHRRRRMGHVWGKPPAGTGKLEVCTMCGDRRTIETEHEPCDAMNREGYVPETQHEYDPH